MFVSERVGTPFAAGVLGLDAPLTAPREVAGKPHSTVVLSVIEDLALIENEWRAFEKTAEGTVFQSFDWQAAWLRHIGARSRVRPAIVVGRGEAGEILFLLPLAVERRGAIRRLTFLASDLCDYNGPLLAPGFAVASGPEGFPALWRQIGRLLQANRRLRHHLVVLDKMPETIGSVANPMLALGVALNPSGAYLATLSGDWDSFYSAKRSSAWRKRDRWKRKRLGDHGPVALVNAEGGEARAATLRTLFAQKSRFFARLGVPDLFARPGYADFFLDIATMPAMADKVHVSSLTVAGQAAATNLGLVSGGRYYHVLVSYCEGELRRFGPGAVHLQELLRYAMARGCALFDFTIGDESYKREWSDVTLRLHDHRAAATPRGLLVLLPAVAGTRAKRFVKQTPVLWRAAVKVRALIGGLRQKPEAAPESDED